MFKLKIAFKAIPSNKYRKKIKFQKLKTIIFLTLRCFNQIINILKINLLKREFKKN